MLLPLAPFGIGTTELMVILVIILVVFGPTQLPKIGRALGGGIKEFKDGLKVGSDGDDDKPKPEARSTTTVHAHPPEALPPHAEDPSGERREHTRDTSAP